MAEIRTLYYGPMDREYHESLSETPKELAIEEPIMTVSELGETVPEHDPAGRFKNIIQTTQAAIRGGAGTIQIVLQTPIESAIGGRPKAYGKEVRETLKEVAMANELNIAGVEMPTSLNNLAGFDYQQLRFSDEKRKQSLDEVKDAIRFVADVGRGGGVDIVSWEFPRQINDADFQPIEEKKKTFENEGEQRIGYLVDERDGRTQQFRKDEIQHLPYDPKTFKHLREEITEEMLEEPRKIELKQFVWEDFVRWAEYNKGENKKQGLKEGDEDFGAETPEEQFFKVQIEGQITTMKGWRTHYADRARNARKLLDGAQEGLREAGDDPVRREVAVKEVRKYEDEYEDYLSTAHGQAQQAAELQERVKHLKPIKKYAMKRSTRTYAEAGVAAMNEYELGRQKGTVTKPLYVGPEIGWPQYFGSHPDEFIKLIKDSRKEFVDLITKPMMEVSDPVLGTKSKPSPYFDSKITREKAEELSKKHVKGLFDTGHMGMWLSHFKPITDEKTGKLETEDVLHIPVLLAFS